MKNILLALLVLSASSARAETPADYNQRLQDALKSATRASAIAGQAEEREAKAKEELRLRFGRIHACEDGSVTACLRVAVDAATDGDGDRPTALAEQANFARAEGIEAERIAKAEYARYFALVDAHLATSGSAQ